MQGYGTYLPTRGGQPGAPGVLVVVLSRDAAAERRMTRLLDGSVRCVWVPTAYEAAAEILASPVEAIVVDFRALSARHLRVLRIARDMQVEVLGVGSPAADVQADRLSGVRLVSWADLPSALERLGASGGQVPSETSEKFETTPDEAPKSAPPAPVEITPFEMAPIETPAERPAEPSPLADTEEPPSSDGILTPEEIAALLEQEP